MKLRGLAVNTADMSALIRCVIANGGKAVGYSLQTDSGQPLARLTPEELLLVPANKLFPNVKNP